MLLKTVTTDAGRGRAWIRAALNEHSLERYVHLFLADPALLEQHYEPWAFVRDEVRTFSTITRARICGCCQTYEI
jgi:sorting nexin-29